MHNVWIGVAGLLGALARYHVARWVAGRTHGVFPWPTLLVNISGSFLLGIVVTVLADRLVADTHLRLALTVGFLGSYTTFSTFALETVALAGERAVAVALLYVGVSVAAGIAAAAAGVVAARLV